MTLCGVFLLDNLPQIAMSATFVSHYHKFPYNVLIITSRTVGSFLARISLSFKTRRADL